MKIRFVNSALHGVADYGAGLGLLTVPFIIDIGNSSPLALWIAVTTGVAVILSSMFTNYKLGLFKVIPFKGHLVVDLSVATLFVILPFAFNFTGLDAYYYWFNAAVVFIVVAVTRPDEDMLS